MPRNKSWGPLGEISLSVDGAGLPLPGPEFILRGGGTCHRPTRLKLRLLFPFQDYVVSNWLVMKLRWL